MIRLSGHPIAIMAAAVAGSILPAPAKVVENVKMAVRVLHLRYPNVTWREPAVRADFTGDQISDLAIMGLESEKLVVALMVGPVSGGSETLRFSWKLEDGEVDASCLRDASLAVEELEPPKDLDVDRSLGTTESGRGTKGLRLDAPPCDVFHLYWDPPTRGLNWWR